MHPGNSTSGNILRIISGVPEHLRKSIIINKILEFSEMSNELKSETIQSVLDGYCSLDMTSLKPMLTTSFGIVSNQDIRLIVKTFCIYFDIILAHPEILQALDLQPIIEVLNSLSSKQKHVLFDCYFEALLLHSQRQRLVSTIPEFAVDYLRTLDSQL
ncbi:MAG TPA: hypothetical protein VH796_07130 [Nitrososphaeraceae archaeon]|jgi:hypothetical protein